MTYRIYHGSCDCGNIRFETGLDLESGTFKCNCKLCWKVRFWGAFINADTFHIQTGEENLSVYGERRKHFFCKSCGVKLFGRGADGVRMVVSVAALDDLDPKELAKAPVRYVDGLHDNFGERPDFTEHL